MPPSVSEEWHLMEMLSVEIPFIFPFGKMWNDVKGQRVCCSPTTEDAIERKASCSPPRGGGGELRDSASRII